MPKQKRALRPGERRCPTCDALVKDDLHLISSIPTIRDIIDKINDKLKTVRWFIYRNSIDGKISIGKSVLRRKKDGQLQVHEWWETEFIIDKRPSDTKGDYSHVIVALKDWWKNNPQDTFSMQAKRFHHEMLAKKGEKL